MTDADELERLARERRDADRRYNDALTMLDRAVVAASERPDLERADFDRLATALIVFLQEITRFVETKDRELAAGVRARDEQIQKALEPLVEMRAQIGILQRSVQASERGRPGSSPEPSPPAAPSALGVTQLALSGAEGLPDYKYVAFEDQFRGSERAIEERLAAYVPLFSGATDVVDLGCGRGEMLTALAAAGVDARGVDANGEMVAIARARGLRVEHGDALTFLRAATDESVGGLVSTQLVEHLEPAYLMQLLDIASRKLRRGAPIVIETINPACWLAFFSSYIRDLTHMRPVHPETLQYLLRASGFERVAIRYSAPVPDDVKMKTVDLPAGLLSATDETSVALARVGHAINANAVILNNLMFTHLDYAVIGYRA